MGARPCQGQGVTLPRSGPPSQPVASREAHWKRAPALALSQAPNPGLCWARGKVTRPWCSRSTSWWSPKTPTAPATSGRSPWTNPTTSSASAPRRATTSGGRGSGRAGGAGPGGRGRGGAWPHPLRCPSPSPSSASQFCRDAAASLSLFYNNGARPCGCHEAGATGPTCEAFGGQCPCRAHVIGRDCSRCATGYWGFPSCRRESLCRRARQRGGWPLRPWGLPGGGGAPGSMGRG